MPYLHTHTSLVVVQRCVLISAILVEVLQIRQDGGTPVHIITFQVGGKPHDFLGQWARVLEPKPSAPARDRGQMRQLTMHKSPPSGFHNSYLLGGSNGAQITPIRVSYSYLLGGVNRGLVCNW